MAIMSGCSSLEPWVLFEQQENTDKSSIIKDGCTLFRPFAAKKPSFPPKNIPDLSGKTTLASLYGWLIVTDIKDPAAIFLFNPFSRATVNLPRLEFLSEDLLSQKHRVKYIMTCVPDDDHIEDGRCVLMISCKSIFMFCRPGFDDSWCMHDSPVKGAIDDDILGVCNGIIYRLVLLTDFGILFRINIGSQDLDDPHLVIRVQSVAQLKLTDLYRSYQSPNAIPYLVESCGQLYCVMLFCGYFNNTDVQDVSVLKFVDKDNNTMEVTEVHSLDNQALFVGSDNCSFGMYVSETCRLASRFGLPSPGLVLQGNCVYILAHLGEKVIYVYHLQDCTLTPIPLFPNLKVPGGSCFWVTSKRRNPYENKEKEIETLKSPEVDEIRHGTQFGDLPDELITRIAMCLPITDYSRFRATSKGCRDLAPPLQSWLDRTAKLEYLEAIKSQTVLPWLLLFKDDAKICNVIDPNNTDTLYLMTTPDEDRSYASMEVVYSKKGWLLMHGHAGNLFFYNPFTKVITGDELPSNKMGGHLRCIGSSTTPVTETGIIVGLHRSGQRLLITSYSYGDGNKAWNIIEEPVKKQFKPANNSPVYYKGVFFFLDMIGRLAKYTVKPEGKHTWEVMSKLKSPCKSSSRMSTYLLECKGQILSVFACLLGRWVKVFRLDFTKKCWVRVKRLKKYMIFLSSSSSFAIPTPSNKPRLGNKLYFTRIHENNGLVCYDLKSKVYCSPNNENISRINFFHTRELLCCTWIEPTWS